MSTTDAPAPPADAAALAERIRDYFRDDGSRLTMMAARSFGVPEQTVLDALTGGWPVARLRDGVFRELVEALPALGTVRVFVRSRAAVIESVGTFGGFSETGPFFNVQTDTLDMHILHEEVGAVYAVQKAGHDNAGPTHSFLFFDRNGDAAFKVYLWENFPNVPPARIEAFHALVRRFAAEGADLARFAPAEVPAPAVEPPPEPPAAPLAPPEPAAAVDATVPAIAPEPEPEPEPVGRFAVPLPEGVVPGSATVGSRILGETTSRAPNEPPPPPPPGARAVRWGVRGVFTAALLGLGYWVASTFVAPLFWLHYDNHMKLTDAPKFTRTVREAPADPLNVGLFGDESALVRSMVAAGWFPADPGTFRVGLQRARAELESRSYPPASPSPLRLFGRTHDLAFAKPAGRTGERVVRLWRSDALGLAGQPLWVGSVSLERRSNDKAPRRTIGADLDAARDALMNDLARVLRLTRVSQVTGVGPTASGANADGDRYYTDGELTLGVLEPRGASGRPPEVVPNPWTVRVKDWLWSEVLRPVLGG